MTDEEMRAHIAGLERTIERCWLLIGGHRGYNTVLAMLPAGGIECERWAERVRDELGAAIGKSHGLRGMRTDDNQPAPRDELDEIADEVMADAERK